MITRGRRLTAGKKPDQQTGPSLFDADERADLRRGLDVLHYLAPNMSLACGVDFAAEADRRPGQRVMTLTRSEATCPDCRGRLDLS